MLRVNTQASSSIQFNPTSYDVAVEFTDGSTGTGGATSIPLTCLNSFVPTNPYTDCVIVDSQLIDQGFGPADKLRVSISATNAFGKGLTMYTRSLSCPFAPKYKVTSF